MKKFIKKLSKNEKIIISTFSPSELGFSQVIDKEEIENYSISLITENILFIQLKDHEKEAVRSLIDEGFSTFYFIGKGQSVDQNSNTNGYCITDHVNMSGINPLRGVNIDKYGVRFPDMSGTYSQIFNDEKLSKLNLHKAKLFVPKNINTLSEIEREALTKNPDLQVLSNEIYSGVITAKHAGCKSYGLVLVDAIDISSLFI